MKKLFSFVAVLLCSAAVLEAGEATVVEWRTITYPTFAEKVYDGTPEAVVTNAAFEISNRIPGRQDVSVEVDYAVYDSERAGSTRQITVYLKLTGSDAEAYTFGENSTLVTEADRVILQKLLYVDASDLEIVVVRNESDFPMDAKAVVVTGAKINESEIIGDDEVTLITTAQFSDIVVGDGKTIYAHYDLDGDDAANYRLDRRQDEYGEKGTVRPAIDIETWEDGLIFHLGGDDARLGICPASEASAVFKISSGVVSNFSVRYTEEEKAVGFVDIVDAPLPAEKTILLSVPATAPCGNYMAEVSLSYFVRENIYRSAWLPIYFSVRVAADDIIAVYNDVVGLRDMDGRYTAFLWYRNGEAINGAGLWYYQQEGGLQGVYKVWVTTVEGDEYFSCEKVFGTTEASAPKKAVNAQGDITIILPNGTTYDAQGNIINK